MLLPLLLNNLLSGDTGAGAIVEGVDVVAGSGATKVSGSGTIAEGVDTVAGAGTAGYPGSGTIAEAHDTVSGTGATKVSGSGTIAEAPDSSSGSGFVGSGGGGAPTEGHDTVSGSGATAAPGSGAIAEAPDVIANTGAATVSGSGTIAEAHDTVAGSGVEHGPISGSGAILEDPDQVVRAGFGDVPDQYSWVDYELNTPPAGYVGASYQYVSSLHALTGDPTVPYTYLGPYRSAVMQVPWKYSPGGADLGAALNVSLDGGVSWVINTIAPVGGGQSLSGNIYVDLTGATKVMVKVTRIMNTLGALPMLTQTNAPLEM